MEPFSVFQTATLLKYGMKSFVIRDGAHVLRILLARTSRATENYESRAIKTAGMRTKNGSNYLQIASMLIWRGVRLPILSPFDDSSSTLVATVVPLLRPGSVCQN